VDGFGHQCEQALATCFIWLSFHYCLVMCTGAVDMFLSGDSLPAMRQEAARSTAQPPAYTAPSQSTALADEPQKVTWSGVEPWLTSLDLSKYLESFTVNEVLDLDTLLELSEEDLKEMEITVGARRKMLASMRTLSTAKAAGTLVNE
jgi:hypothetical protein